MSRMPYRDMWAGGKGPGPQETKHSKRLKKAAENSEFCMCPYLGKVRLVRDPPFPLGSAYCHTCGKKVGI